MWGAQGTSPCRPQNIQQTDAPFGKANPLSNTQTRQDQANRQLTPGKDALCCSKLRPLSLWKGLKLSQMQNPLNKLGKDTGPLRIWSLISKLIKFENFLEISEIDFSAHVPPENFSLSSTGNSNPAYPKQLESITPAINDTSFLLSCPVTGRTQNSPLAISDPINNSEKSLLRPLVEAFLVSQRLWISQSPEWREPKTNILQKNH